LFGNNFRDLLFLCIILTVGHKFEIVQNAQAGFFETASNNTVQRPYDLTPIVHHLFNVEVF